MPTTMSASPVRGPMVLTQKDVRALFELIALALYDPKEEEDVAFSGATLASWFEAYGQHVIKLMTEWEGLSKELTSEGAKDRARALNARLRQMATEKGLVDSGGRTLKSIGEPEAPEIRSLILGKGMEI
jgi:hypothetical protein